MASSPVIRSGHRIEPPASRLGKLTKTVGLLDEWRELDERSVFVRGRTRHVGQRLIQELLARGHRARALARPGSKGRLPPSCVTLLAMHLTPPHTKPASRLRNFCAIGWDRASESVENRTVSQRGPCGWSRGRTRCETCRRAALRLCQLDAAGTNHEGICRGQSGMRELDTAEWDECDILRPWYVLGPGHRWPYALIPLYRILSLISVSRESASRLGLVTLPQMVRWLVGAVENPSSGVRVISVPEIRSAQR